MTRKKRYGNRFCNLLCVKKQKYKFYAPDNFFIFGESNAHTMISASQMKLIRSLRQKKYRDLHCLYLVEGEKMVRELVEGSHSVAHRPVRIYATADWLLENEGWFHPARFEVTEAHEKELAKVSNLMTPQPVIAVVSMPEKEAGNRELSDHPVLVFESIRDPGNLGTILRTANWFGINQVVCSPDSADLFNPKVVQATMGAIFRVSVHYLELGEWLSVQYSQSRRIYGTFLEGESIYHVTLDRKPVFLFGNESTGLSNHYDRFLCQKITIPAFPGQGNSPESLNVAASVAVVCSEWRRGF
jgi:TrmH family RNA methyltransferase